MFAGIALGEEHLDRADPPSVSEGQLWFSALDME